jgi:hypothetical protein
MQSTPNDRAKEQGPSSTGPPDPKTIELPEDLAFIQYTPTDPRWSEQWGPQSIKCPQAWDIETGDLDVLIAIVDTGIDYYHEDLTHYVAGGYDWYNNDSNPMDDHSHGTHCAGIAAATMDNSIGIAGVAQVGVMAEKVCSAGGSCPWFESAQGITHAADSYADVISMSFGGGGGSTQLETACQYAWDAGAVLVAASGNGGGTPVDYPARYETVICVGSIDEYDVRYYSSQYGPSMELVAPGEDILSTTPGDTYGYKTGTSMSTPHVAGVAALVLSYYPSYSNSGVRTLLADTAEDLGATGWDEYYGYGKVNAYEALGGAAPGLITQIYPSGDIYYDNNPTYTWCEEGSSTYYYLWVDGPSYHFDQWYHYTAVCSGGTCSATPGDYLSGGDYIWWILGWNSGGGSGIWNSEEFSIGPPGEANLVSPSGVTTDTTPTYIWDRVQGSTWYYLWVNGPSGHVLDQWYTAEDVTSGEICSVTPGTTLEYGDHLWWILTYNPIGYGPWSDCLDFTVESEETGFDEDFCSWPPNWDVAYGDWSTYNCWLYSGNYEDNWASVYCDAEYSNFVYEAKLWRGDGGGNSNAIVVRGDPYPFWSNNKWNTAYYFQYSRNGNYGIWKATGGGSQWIQPWTYTAALNQGGAWNNLKVWCVGDRMYFFINDDLVYVVTDNSFNKGKVGLGYYAGAGGGFWTDYATLEMVGVAAIPVEEVSKKQRQLNEKANIKNAGLPIDYCPIKKQKNTEESG